MKHTSLMTQSSKYRSRSMTHYTISNDGTNPSTLNDSHLTETSLANLKQSSGFGTPQRKKNQAPTVYTVGHEVDSTIHSTISYVGANTSKIKDLDLTGIDLAKLEKRSFGFTALQRKDNQSPTLDTVGYGKGYLPHNTISYNRISPSTLNDLDLTSIASAEPELQTNGLNSSERKENQSSAVNTAVHREDSTTYYAVSYEGTNPLMLNDLDIPGVALGELEQLSASFDSELRQDRGSFDGFSTSQNLGTRMIHLGIPNRSEVGSMYPFAAFNMDSGNMHGPRPQIIDVGSLFSDRKALWEYEQGELNSRHEFPVPVAPWEQKQGGPKKIDDAIAQCYAKLNRESLKKGFGKIRQLTSKESISNMITKTKTMSKTVSKKWKNSSLSEAIGKVRNCKCVQHALRNGQKPPGEFYQDPRADNQYRPRPDFPSFKPPNYEVQDPRVDNKYRPRQDFPSFKPPNYEVQDPGADNKHRPRQDFPAFKPPNDEIKVSAKNEKWSDFELECLKAHNQYRDKHGVPRLKLNKVLCKSAQAYADRLAVIDPREDLDHSNEAPAGMYGENLGAFGADVPVTGRKAVDGWYNEINNYNFNTASAIDPTKDYAHFTQLVWKDSTDLGVAYAESTMKSNAKYVVCHYKPEGNIVYKISGPIAKQEFHANVPRPIK